MSVRELTEDDFVPRVTLLSSVRTPQAFRTLPAADLIVLEVLRAHGISREKLLSRSRLQHIVDARRDVALRLRHELRWSFPAIGQFLQRDHTTIMYLVDAPRRDGRPRREVRRLWWAQTGKARWALSEAKAHP